MQSQFVFQGQKEIERLAVQNRLLSLYERPMVEKFFSGGAGWTVLDIGCNDGRKTVQRFSDTGIGRVVGLEYNENLAQTAQERYGNEKFSFHHCDVEAPDFTEQLCRLCEQEAIGTFDMIYLSFLLMHLSDPVRLLQRLRPFLKDGGCLLVIEPNDAVSKLDPDPQELLPAFLAILAQDKYAGNRSVGTRLPQLLQQAGYEEIHIWQEEISAKNGEMEKKQDVFQTFFSYLPEDVALLQSQEPENPRYQAWHDWLQQNFEDLRNAVIQENGQVYMGVQMVSCKNGVSSF